MQTAGPPRVSICGTIIQYKDSSVRPRFGQALNGSSLRSTLGVMGRNEYRDKRLHDSGIVVILDAREKRSSRPLTHCSEAGKTTIPLRSAGGRAW